LIRASTVSFLNIFLDTISLWFMVASVAEPVSVLTILLIIPVARISNLAPSPGGSGFYEITMAGLLVLTSEISLGHAVSAALLYRLGTFYVGLSVGFLAFTKDDRYTP
jgi:hypothetical protein